MHTDDELKAMFRLLREKVHGSHSLVGKIVIRTEGPLADRVGEFAIRGRLGIVSVYLRPERPAVAHFCTLCHELGHARSWQNGERSAEYERVFATDPLSSLDPESKALVIDEESRAWRYGLEFAGMVGFQDGPAYLSEAQRAMTRYFEDLSLPIPEPAFMLPEEAV